MPIPTRLPPDLAISAAATPCRGWYLHPGVTLATFLVSLFQICCFDTFWHLRIGEILWHGGGILNHNQFSWTFPEQAWRPTYWLFEAVLYPVFTLGGPVAWILAQALVLALAWGSLAGFLARRLDPGGRYPVCGLLLLLIFLAAIDVSLFRFMFRPHLFTFLGLSLLIQLLERWREAPDRFTPWWQIPLLFLLWANLHSGVVFGFAYFAIVLTSVAWDALRRHGLALRDVRRWWREEPLLCRGLLLLLGAVAASLLNPTGPVFIAYVADHLRMDNVIQLEELAPLDVRLHAREAAVMGFFLILPPLLLAYCRRLRPEHLLIPVFGIFLLAHGIRFIPKVCLMALPMTVAALMAYRERCPDGLLCRWQSGVARRWPAVAGLGVAVLFAAYVHGRIYRLPESCFHSGFGIAADSFPLQVAKAMPPQLARGLYTSFTMGGYVTWRFQDRVKVFQDGRIHAYPLAFFREVEDLRSTLAGCGQLVARYGITAVLLNKTEDPVLAIYVARQPRQWTIKAEDEHFLYAEKTAASPAGPVTRPYSN